MTTLESLAAAMFPAITHTPEDYEAMYPPRALKEGARVTRIAPSPTGYLHLGVFFTAMVNRLSAWRTTTKSGRWQAARRIFSPA